MQCKCNSTACDKSAKIAASAWWHAGALRLKLRERAGIPAYLNNWRTPEAQPEGGGDNEAKRSQHHGEAGGWDAMGWGGGGGWLRQQLANTRGTTRGETTKPRDHSTTGGAGGWDARGWGGVRHHV